MKSRLSMAGHPVHPMIVAFPIALYVTAFLCDILYAILRDTFWLTMAFWAIIFGLIANVGAAATGFPDFLAILRERSEARRAANSHLVFGISLLVVQGLNALIRAAGDLTAERMALPLVVDVMAVGLVAIQGWYGGELVYRYRIGVSEPEVVLPGKHKERKHPH